MTFKASANLITVDTFASLLRSMFSIVRKGTPDKVDSIGLVKDCLIRISLNFNLPPKTVV